MIDFEFISNNELEEDDNIVEKVNINSECGTPDHSNLAEFLRHFPLSISILVKILNESFSNNPIPSDLLEKNSTADLYKNSATEQSFSGNNKLNASTNLSNNESNNFVNLKRPHDFYSTFLNKSSNFVDKNKIEFVNNYKNEIQSESFCLPPLKKHFANISKEENPLSNKTKIIQKNQNKIKEEFTLFKNPNADNLQSNKIIEKTNDENIKENNKKCIDYSVSPLTTAMVQILINELRNVQRDQSLALNRRRLLNPLIGLLNACLENGTRYAMNVLIEAMFENINSQKMISLLDVLKSNLHFFCVILKFFLILADAPIFLINYNEFDTTMNSDNNFYNSSIFCGAIPFPSEKMILEIGTGKINSKMSPLQTQQIYDCRHFNYKIFKFKIFN